MKRSTALAVLFGVALAAILMIGNDWRQIAATLTGAGWSLLIVVLLHLPQTLASAFSWRVLMTEPTSNLTECYGFRWIRDSINTLLPVAQIGGEVARVRLLAHADGPPLPAAAASVIVDISLDIVAQIVFTMGAVLILLSQPGRGTVSTLSWVTSMGCVAISVALIGVQRSGLLKFLERLASKILWLEPDSLTGLHAAIFALYAHPRRIGISIAGHLASWILGGLETYAALWVIGVPASVAQAIVIEALSHAARAAGFFVPGAIGIQEGGYVLVCKIYGIGAPDALTLSMVKRLRELVLGLPGLLLWGWMERRRPSAHSLT